MTTEVQAFATVAGRSPAALDVAHLGHVQLLTPRLDDSLRCFTEVRGMREVECDLEVMTGADLMFDPDSPTRTWTAAERRRGIGWGIVFPAGWHDYGTPDVRATR